MFYLLYRIKGNNKYWIVNKNNDKEYLMENHKNLKTNNKEEYTLVDSKNMHDNFYFDSFELFKFNENCKVIYRI